MNKRVVITGLGVVSSIGIGWKDFWDSLLNGKSGISPVTSFDTSEHFTHNGGEVKFFNPEDFIPLEELKTMSRANQLALVAAKLAAERCFYFAGRHGSSFEKGYLHWHNIRVGTGNRTHKR